MCPHDIIDNRNEKLIDHINRMLSSSQAARFAVGYFFLSGFEGIAGKLDGVKDLIILPTVGKIIPEMGKHANGKFV